MTPTSVVLVEFSPSGGLFQFAVQLGEALAARGHQVELLTGPDPELDTTQPGFTISPVLPTWHPAAGAADSHPRRRLRRVVRAVRHHLAWLAVVRLVVHRSPDVVQLTSGRFPVDGLAPWLLARLRRRPVLVTVAHAPLPWNEQHPTGRLHKEDPILERCLGVGYRNVDAVLVLGERSAADLASRWPDVRHVHVMPHGDEGVFLREEPSGAATTKPLVLFFGTLQAYKGLDLLLDAFALVRAERPDARLLIAGAPSGDTDLHQLRRRSDALGNVELRAGYVPLSEVAALFANARTVVAPYRSANASGVIALAHTCARPVVATAVGDLPAVVQHEQTGLLVPPTDAVALAVALVRLLDDSDEAERLGLQGRRHLVDSASWQAVAEQVEAVFLGCLSTPRATRRARTTGSARRDTRA